MRRIKVTATIASLAALLVLKPVQAEGGWLPKCLKADEQSDGQCYLEYTLRLKREQAGILRRIRSALEADGRENSERAKASNLLQEAQKHWTAFVAKDCEAVANLFEGGNAIGLDEQDCIIQHYRVRNAYLKKLESEHLTND